MQLPAQSDGILSVKQGEGFYQIFDRLQSEGVISCSRCAKLHLRTEHQGAIVFAGDYQFDGNTTLRDLISTLVEHRLLIERISLIEGTSIAQFLKKLRNTPHIEPALKATTPEELAVEMGWKWPSAEGMLLPDTYQYTRGTTDREIIATARKSQQDVLDALWSERGLGLPYKQQFDLIVLASVVEKETHLAEERPLVAGVFVNRLLNGMRLEADATLLYRRAKGITGRIRRSELKADQPYNTYVHHGLPPTAITTPSLASLAAAASPERQYYFFVVKPGGGHHFSTTFREHLMAVEAYHTWRDSGAK